LVGKISEVEYITKVKIYGEKIRDLNREIAVADETIQKILYAKNKKNIGKKVV
jgi:hypothetical protein